MRPFTALERLFERLFERSSARLLGARLEPLLVLRRLERAVEESGRPSPDGVVVADRYAVRLAPGDLATLADGAPDLAADLADGILRLARSRGYRLDDRPRVDLVPDPAVAAGDVAVVAVRATPDPGRTADPGLALVPTAAADTARGGATLVYRPPRPIGPLARLRVRQRDGTTHEVVVDGQGLSIGRAPDNDLVLADPRVSRRHARLVVRFGGLVLVDTDSRNGVAVNGQAVREIALGVGDEIRIGDALLVVEAP